MRRVVWVVALAMVAAVTTGGGLSAAAAPTANAAAPGPNVVVNGGFESGRLNGWTTSGTTAAVSPGHSGNLSAQLGSPAPTNGDSTMQQAVTVPAGATLSFWYQPHCTTSLPTTDKEQMQVRSPAGADLVTVLDTCANSTVWTHATRSLSAFAGQSVVLWFNNHDDNLPAAATDTLFDEVSLRGVTTGDFSVSASPSTVSVDQGSSATSTISTALTSGAAQSVALSASGLPAGAGASFNPATVTTGGSSVLTITTSVATPTGTSTVTVTGTGTSATHSTTISLTVTAPQLVPLSSDPYTTTGSQHATEVEPDTLSIGATMVSVFQVGRFTNGGSNDIGWVTTTDSGQTWAHGFLPGITTSQGGGTWARVSDPSVAYDAKHGVWLVAGLDLDSGAVGRGVTINRSTDGLTWSNPVQAVTSTTSFLDKSWIACDRTTTSPNYGNCYVEYDNNSSGNIVLMLTSTDGGITWSAPRMTADTARGLGGQPLVQPSGNVVVPYWSDGTSQIRSFVSSDGGATWGSSVLVASQADHSVAGGFRSEPLPSAEMDAAGTVYLTWQDCKFRTGCPANDIVLATSTSGATWSAVQRIPIDGVSSTVDHFIPGIGVDRATSGSTAHLALYYYFYPATSCSAATCQLDVGYISSSDGGATWSPAAQVAGPMNMGQLASTTQGRMVGDYISTSFLGGRAYSVFAVGMPPAGAAFNEPMETVAGGRPVSGGTARADIGAADSTGAPPRTREVPATAY
jgi:hypothetical protein